MRKIKYTFDSVFLDFDYSDLFLEMCKKKGLIHHDIFGNTVTYDGRSLIGEKELLRTLVLFDKVDFGSSIYDCTELLDKELITNDSICCSNIDPDYMIEKDAVSIMSAYKDSIINFIKNDYKKKLKILQNPKKTPSYEFWKDRKYSDELINSVYFTDGGADIFLEYLSSNSKTSSVLHRAHVPK